MTDTFYSSIEPVADFEALTRAGSYRALPDDWSVVAADVVGSTDALRAGRYKQVNTVGVSVIAAVRNATRGIEVPYIFGGDGATLCVPDRKVADVRTALAGTVATARSGFGLELRAAAVPVATIRARGLEVLVARHQVSPHYVQCALFGGGAEWVEEALKRGELDEADVVHADPDAAADFTGLECRWSEVPSPAAETVALIVESRGRSEEALDTFGGVLERIRGIYGDAEQCRPVVEKGLRVTLDGAALSDETRLHHSDRGHIARAWATLKLQFFVLIGSFLMAAGVRTESADWGSYKEELVQNTDFRKFDGSVRLILAGSKEQREELTTFLDYLSRDGTIRYGIHVARSALMTCLIEKREGAHFHFVDAAGGGYAAAAAAVKARSE